MEYPFISKINANIQNPLKSPFEALNYYMGLKASYAKTDFSTAFQTSQPSFTTSKYLFKIIWGDSALFFVYNNNKFIQYYHFAQVLPIKITIINN